MFSIHQRLIVYVFPALSGAFKLFNDYYEFLKVSFVAMLKIFTGVTKHNSLFMRYSKNKQVIGNIWIQQRFFPWLFPLFFRFLKFFWTCIDKKESEEKEELCICDLKPYLPPLDVLPMMFSGIISKFVDTTRNTVFKITSDCTIHR